MAIRPSRRSAPRIRRSPPNSASHAARQSGSRTATLPQTARLAPAEKTSQSAVRLFDAAAVLDFEPCACGDAFEHFQVGRTLRPGAVQIDHVQPPQPRRFEAQGRVERVAAVGRAAVVVALCESHAGAVYQIHRGNDFDIHLISVLGSCVESGCPPPRSFRGGTACRRSCRVRVPR